MALPRHVAADRHEPRGAEPIGLRAEQRGDDHIAPGAQAAVGPHLDPVAQAVLDEQRLRLREPQLPRRARMFDRRQRRRPRAAVVTRDEHVVCVCLRDTRRHAPDPRFGHELHADACARIHLFQVVNQLRQVLDRVDVVMRRRRDERHARHGVPEARDQRRDFVSGELTTFARLRPLGHLDLELVGAYQIVRRHAEAPRRDLLDTVIGPVAILEWGVRVGIFAPLARVGAGPHAVHADRERAMRLGRQRAQGHRRRNEAPADRLGGLHFVERDRRARTDGEQIARAGREPCRHACLEAVVCLGRVLLHGRLHRPHQRGRPPVVLAVAAIAHAPMVGQGVGRRGLRVGRALARQHVLGDLGEPDPADRRHRAGEATVDHLGTEAQGLEDLGAAVRRERGDAHLGKDLEQPLLGRGAELGRGRVGLDMAPHRFERQPGMDRFGTESDEGGEVMHVPRVARFGDEADSRPPALAEQVLVHRADRERHRQRRALAVGRAIADHENLRALLDGPAGRAAQGVERGAQRLGAARRLPRRVQRHRLRADQAPQRRHLILEQHRVLVPYQPQARGAIGEQRAATPQMHAQGHHERLAQRIDRGVRDLREPLAQVRVEARRYARERRDRRVVPHAPHGVLAFAAHRLEHVANIFEAPTERELPRHDLGFRTGRGRGGGPQRPDALRRPARVRTTPRHLALRLGVVEDRLAPGVDHQQLARAEPSALDHARGVQVHEPDLGARHHQPVARDLVAAGAQPIAIERRSDHHTVRERQRRRPVPRLHQAVVELVEAAQRGLHLHRALVRLRHEHHEGVHRVAAGAHQQLERVVEAGRVAPLGPDHRLQPVDVLFPQR